MTYSFRHNFNDDIQFRIKQNEKLLCDKYLPSFRCSRCYRHFVLRNFSWKNTVTAAKPLIVFTVTPSFRAAWWSQGDLSQPLFSSDHLSFDGSCTANYQRNNKQKRTFYWTPIDSCWFLLVQFASSKHNIVDRFEDLAFCFVVSKLWSDEQIYITLKWPSNLCEK